MPQVEGIGGVFIESEDPAALTDWYAKMFGLSFDSHEGGSYIVFFTRDIKGGFVRANPVFAINPAKEPLAVGAARGYVLNLRVDDLHRMLDHLRARGVDVDEKTIEWEGGKHGWIRDLDGNRLELYEEIVMEPPPGLFD